jgi:hypothetical protein
LSCEWSIFKILDTFGNFFNWRIIDWRKVNSFCNWVFKKFNNEHMSTNSKKYRSILRLKYRFTHVICTSANVFFYFIYITFLNKGELIVSCRRLCLVANTKLYLSIIPGNVLNSIWEWVEVTKLCLFFLFNTLDSWQAKWPFQHCFRKLCNIKNCWLMHYISI